jgi:Uma2 family endonuclease
MAVELKRRRFTVDEYHLMGDAGVFHPGERVELIDGAIVDMTPIGRRHATAHRRSVRSFHRLVGERALIDSQDPVVIGEFGEPQPDVVLLRPRPDDYLSAHPMPADVLLVVEIVDSSLEYDRRVKLPMYAKAGIPEAWVENLIDGVVEVCTEPGPDGYRTVRVARRGETVRPTAFPDVEIPVAELLP